MTPVPTAPRRAKRREHRKGRAVQPERIGYPLLAAIPGEQKGQAMQRSSERILTTHAGSLPRPEALL